MLHFLKEMTSGNDQFLVLFLFMNFCLLTFRINQNNRMFSRTERHAGINGIQSVHSNFSVQISPYGKINGGILKILNLNVCQLHSSGAHCRAPLPSLFQLTPRNHLEYHRNYLATLSQQPGITQIPFINIIPPTCISTCYNNHLVTP